MSNFNYQTKMWGGSKVRLSLTYLAYLNLKYCLFSLKNVKGRVLDVGCGAGGFAKAIKFYRPDLEVYGVDISLKAINLAKKKPQGVKFIAGDLYKLAFKNNFFKAVVAEDVLEHLEDPKLALQEVRRVLKKGGIFQAHVPLEGKWWSLHFLLSKLGLRFKEKLSGHIQHYTYKDLENLFTKAGFRIIKKRNSGYLFEHLVDVFYFIFLHFSGKRIKTGLEHYLEQKSFLNFFKKIIAVVCNLESMIFSFLPGLRLHVVAEK